MCVCVAACAANCWVCDRAGPGKCDVACSVGYGIDTSLWTCSSKYRIDTFPTCSQIQGLVVI